MIASLIRSQTVPQAALRRCSGAPISAYLADSVPAIVSAMVGAIRGGTGASPRLGRTRDTVSWGGDPDLSASTEGRVLRVVPGGNERSGEGRTEVQRVVLHNVQGRNERVVQCTENTTAGCVMHVVWTSEYVFIDYHYV